MDMDVNQIRPLTLDEEKILREGLSDVEDKYSMKKQDNNASFEGISEEEFNKRHRKALKDAEPTGIKKRKEKREKIFERNPMTGVIRWRYVGESPDKFGWPNYGRILNEKKKNKKK